MDVTDIPVFKKIVEECCTVPEEIIEFWHFSNKDGMFENCLFDGGRYLECRLSQDSDIVFLPAFFSDTRRLYLHSGGLIELCEHLKMG